ncbi:STAS domain-containing protein [Methanoregula sp.]|uniref:STAS domain-containing protein n=1 Tax=Methanoregula sp. TaxID=2052170 RepID=UPI0035617B58
MDITTTTQEGITMLALSGRLDTTTSSDLEHEINSQIDSGNRRILLNFAGTTYISSGGMRVLLATAKKLRTDGDQFGLCCLTADVYKVLKLAGFTSLFSIYPSEGEALVGLR